MTIIVLSYNAIYTCQNMGVLLHFVTFATPPTSKTKDTMPRRMINGIHNHSWNWTILRSAELMQNVLQDHKNLHVAE